MLLLVEVVFYQDSQRSHKNKHLFSTRIHSLHRLRQMFACVFELILINIFYEFVKTCSHKFKRVNKHNFIFEFIFIIINTFRETDVFLFYIWYTVNLTATIHIQTFYKQMRIITREVMKYHWDELGFRIKPLHLL